MIYLRVPENIDAMPVTIVQSVSCLVQFDFQFQCSRAKVDQQPWITRFQFDGDEIYTMSFQNISISKRKHMGGTYSESSYLK